MGTIKGDAFYEKLQQLKEENKKTLESYERLYLNKILLERVGTNESFELELQSSGMDAFDDGAAELSIKGEGQVFKKSKQTVASKPPPGKPREAQLHTPVQSKSLPKKSSHISKLEQPNSAPTKRSYSLDNEDWQQEFYRSRGSNENFIIPHSPNSSIYEEALAKVDKLWKDFQIAEYAQKRRHSFSTSKSKEKSNDSNMKSTEWRHRITIPEPFKMSIREATKEKKRTSAQEELEQQRLAKQKQEEAECEKKFKASPVPAHVYLPLFEEIMERNESRRKYAKLVCQELLQSEIKPFSFDLREQKKKLMRAQSAPVRRPEQRSSNFKAKPIPRHIFSPEIDDKFLEEEELRKIRIKMRSRELLKEASLPPNMAAREKLKEQERKEKLKSAKLKSKKKPKRSIYDIPDYDFLYNEFKKELANRRYGIKETVVEPFNLRTEHIHSRKDRILKDIKDDKNSLKDKHWPYKESKITSCSSLKYIGALSDFLDYIPSQTTRSAELRSTKVKKEKDRSTNHQKEEEEAEKRRKAREAKLRQYLSEKTNSTEILNPRDSIADRLKRMKKDDRERQEAYEREIKEMNARIEKSPLLVEKYMAENAKRAADKSFKAALLNAGLDDKEFKSSKSSRPPASVRSDITNASVENSYRHHGDDTQDGEVSKSAGHHGDDTQDGEVSKSADRHGDVTDDYQSDFTDDGDKTNSQHSSVDLTHTTKSN